MAVRAEERAGALQTINFRVPPAIRRQLEAAASENGRSLSAELLSRLEESFHGHKVLDLARDQLRMALDREDDLREALKHTNELMDELRQILREERKAREASATFPLVRVESVDFVEPPRTSKKRKTEKT